MPDVLRNGVNRQMRPSGLLLDAIDPFDLARLEVLGNGPAEFRWLAGVQFQPRPCVSPKILSLDPCVLQTWDDTGADCTPYITQMPFQVQDVIKGSTLTMTDQEMADILERRARETLSWAFAKALVGPVVTPNTLTLSSAAHAPVSHPFNSPAVPVNRAIAILENELARTMFGAQGMIHMSPGLLHLAQAGGGLDEDEETDAWTTVNGTRVVGDSGYVDAPQPQPLTGTVSARTPDTDEWMYASGLVEYQVRAGGLVGTMGNEYTDIGANKIRRFLESSGILLFDPCPVTAVLASYT